MKKDYIYGSEKFYIEDTEACSAIVSDGENEVTIKPSSGNFETRRADGWGGWDTSMQAAVDRACSLLVEARTSKTNDDRCEEIHDFVKSLP